MSSTQVPEETNQELAKNGLLQYLLTTRSQKWAVKARPDQMIRHTRACDYILSELESGAEAALEVTSYGWPLRTTTSTARLRSLANRLQSDLNGALTGVFSLGVDLNRHQSKSRNRKILREWLVENGENLGIGKQVLIPGADGLNVMRLSAEGPCEMWFNQYSASIHYPDWMNDLETVMKENASKFDGVTEVPRWLLVIYRGVSEKFEVTGQTLSVPDTIDELFFIDHWPPEAKHIVEYAKVTAPKHDFDRTTGAVRVPYSARNQEQGEYDA
jgi:hypothetical protein